MLSKTEVMATHGTMAIGSELLVNDQMSSFYNSLVQYHLNMVLHSFDL